MADMLDLPMERPAQIYTISYNESAKKFIGVIRDLDIKVLNIVVTIYIFVAEVIDPKYLMILGNPYLVSTRAEIVRNGKGTYIIKIYNQYSRKTAKLYTSVGRYSKGDNIEEMIYISRAPLNESADQIERGLYPREFEA